MDFFKQSSLRLLCVILALTAVFTSCELDDSPEPDHPLYVTYSISADNMSFDGPEQLLLDIKSWIKTNQVVYDKQVSYTTGEASEFAKTDAEAVKKYEEFLPKFIAYLDEVKKKLAANAYRDDPSWTSGKVTATFYAWASRTQGQDGHLKYEQLEFVYPEPDSQQ